MSIAEIRKLLETRDEDEVVFTEDYKKEEEKETVSFIEAEEEVFIEAVKD